ncbi:MAG TPA: MFS transporter [Pyrinomonadaceae bacterium]|nr:MFS transporter [Pyrinomonadaceae bacterium]
MRKNWKWLVVGLLFFATLLNYLDRQTIAVSATVISKEFALNDTDLGRLFFGFLFAYGVAQLFIGTLLDRLNVKIAYALAVIAWSLSGAAAALAGGFASLFFLRMLLGVCESPNWPLALRVVARTIPPHQRSLATGIFQSGTSIGALVAAPLIIFLTQAYGWRFAFVAVGACGFVWAALWMTLYRSDENAGEAMSNASGAAGVGNEPAAIYSPSTLKELFGSRVFWGLFVAACFLQPLQYFYITWLPRYFEAYAGVSFGKELASRLVIVYLALDVGFLTGGAIVILLARRLGVRGARKAVIAVGALLMMSIPLVSLLRDINYITAFLCVATFGLGWFQVNYLTFTSEVSIKKASTATGLLGGAGSMAGAAFMLFVGGTVEQSKSFSIAFIIAGLMPLISLAGILISTTTRANGEPPLDAPLSQAV